MLECNQGPGVIMSVKYLVRKFQSQVRSFPGQVYWTCQTFIDNMEISFLFFLKRIYIIMDIEGGGPWYWA